MVEIRRHSRHAVLAVCVVVLPAAAACGGPTDASAPADRPRTTAPAPAERPIPAGSAAPVAVPYTPDIDPAAFSATVANPYFPLRPGMRWEYRSATDDGVESTVVEVTSVTRTILGVPCVQVRDTVRVDGDVVEDTLDWYGQDHQGTVWYFGEDTKEYDHGKVTSTEGSWQAGENGARPGIIMPAAPQAGDRYRQEYLHGHAEDIAEVLGRDENARVPAGEYQQVLVTKETTPLEPEALERKYYAHGVGPVLTVDVTNGGARDELIRFSG